MDWIDYRERLGLDFYDENKYQYFSAKIFNALHIFAENYHSGYLGKDEYYAFCNLTGTPIDNRYSQGHERLKHCLSVIGQAPSLNEFIAYYIALINSIDEETDGIWHWTRSDLSDLLCNALSESHIPFDLLKDNDEFFIFPKGAKELDDALVSEPLEWLSNYPGARKTFVIALRQYSDGIYIRDVADNLRKALETFLQEFLGNRKNLETNKNEICRYLDTQGVDASISGLFHQLINTYKNTNDRTAKHDDAVDKRLLEFLLYQTGILIRMAITIKMSKNNAEV